MRNEPPAYRAYLLRLWLNEQEETRREWRASLEDSRTGERLGFASLEQMFAYLLALTEGATASGDGEKNSGRKGEES